MQSGGLFIWQIFLPFHCLRQGISCLIKSPKACNKCSLLSVKCIPLKFSKLPYTWWKNPPFIYNTPLGFPLLIDNYINFVEKKPNRIKTKVE